MFIGRGCQRHSPYVCSGVGSNCGLGGGPKCIGRMNQNNINPVNNNAINKDKYTNVNNVSNLLRSIRRILKLRNPEKTDIFFTYGPFARTRSHIWPDYWGGQPPLLHYWGGSGPPSPPPPPPPVPTPLVCI